MLKRFVLLVILCVISVSLFSQEDCVYSLSGQITDLDDGSELEGCFVTLFNQSNAKITNSHGKFRFDNLCRNSYSVLIQHIGCKDTIIKIEVNSNITLNIKLPHSAIEFSAIDVMDKKHEISSTQSESSLSGAGLESQKGKNLADMLSTISGVGVLKTGSNISKPMIHGMQGYRLLILNNGIRQEGQQWGNEHAPEIDPFIAQKITVIKGANAIKYGSDAISGVVLVEPNDLPDTASVTGEVNVIGMSNGRAGVVSGILQGYFDKLKGINWRVQGTLKNKEILKLQIIF